MKKIFSVFLLILMLANVCSMTSCGFMKQEEGSDGLIFRLNEDGETCTLVGTQNCMDTDIVIPSSFKGKKVTGIDNFAFSEFSKTKIKNITIPDTVVYANSLSFSYLDHEGIYRDIQIDTITLERKLSNDNVERLKFLYLFFTGNESIPESTTVVLEDAILYYDELEEAWIVNRK